MFQSNKNNRGRKSVGFRNKNQSKASRRVVLNWEGGLEERTLLAYDALGTGLTTFFSGIQAPINAQVTGTQFPLLGSRP